MTFSLYSVALSFIEAIIFACLVSLCFGKKVGEKIYEHRIVDLDEDGVSSYISRYSVLIFSRLFIYTYALVFVCFGFMQATI